MSYHAEKLFDLSCEVYCDYAVKYYIEWVFVGCVWGHVFGAIKASSILKSKGSSIQFDFLVALYSHTSCGACFHSQGYSRKLLKTLLYNV